MKRITSVLLVLTFVCVLCACGLKTAGDVQNTETEAKQDMTSSEPAEGEMTPETREISSKPSERQEPG